MAYLGDFADGGTVYGYFSTHDSAGANVAPSTAFEAADIVVYKDGSATQLTVGITVTSPFDTEVGFHKYEIDLTATGYDTGSDYTVVLAPDETVDGQTITAVPLDTFSIQNRFMRGTDSAATAAALTAVDGKIDTLDTVADQILADTGTDGVVVSMGQALPSTPTPDTTGDALKQATRETAPKKNVALSNIPFKLVLSTDGRTGATGASVTVQYAQDGDTGWTAGSGTVAEIGNGIYTYDALQAEMNADTVTFRFSATGADSTEIAISTVE